MSKSYPIWVDVDACIYKSSKSYGVKDTGVQNFKIGSSKSNSHDFVKTVITRREDGDKIVFIFSVDDVIVKKAYCKNNNGRAGELIEVVDKRVLPESILGANVSYSDESSKDDPTDVTWSVLSCRADGTFELMSSYHRIVGGLSREDFKLV